jgi:cell division protein FtsL
MKTAKLNTLSKTFLTGILATAMLFVFSSCAKKITFLTSSVVPAAEGQITVKNDKNNNYNIQMQITNLADIERLQPAKKSYVVWMETMDNLPKNIGRISSSKKLKVDFNTVSTMRPTKIFITAEEDETSQYPGSMVVLTTDRF